MNINVYIPQVWYHENEYIMKMLNSLYLSITEQQQQNRFLQTAVYTLIALLKQKKNKDKCFNLPPIRKKPS